MSTPRVELEAARAIDGTGPWIVARFGSGPASAYAHAAVKVCPYCAEELADDIVECTQCGRDTTVEPGWRQMPQPTVTPSAEQIVRASEERASSSKGGGRTGVNRLAVASFIVVMVVGVLGTAASFPPAPAVAAFAVALGIGVKAIQETRSESGESGFGFAVAAVVLSLIGLLGYGRQLIT